MLSYCKIIYYQVQIIKIQILDTAVKSHFDQLNDHLFEFFWSSLVFDISTKETFENVTIWMNDIKKYGKGQYCYYISYQQNKFM